MMLDNGNGDSKWFVQNLIKRRKEELDVEFFELDRRAGLDKGRFSALVRRRQCGRIAPNEVLGIARALKYDPVAFLEAITSNDASKLTQMNGHSAPPSHETAAKPAGSAPSLRFCPYCGEKLPGQ